jgi:antitoxin YefM
MMSITASEARRNLFPLIEEVNNDRTVVEIVSRRGNAVLMSAEDYAALAETAYLLRSPENARRLLTAYTDARDGRNLVGRDLSALEAMADQA